MTKQILFTVILLSTFSFQLSTAFAQVPQAFNYQSIVRDKLGNPMMNTNISVKASIRDGSETGESVYQETHAVTTTAFGLITLEIGHGVAVKGIFSDIKWGTGSKWMQVEADFGEGYIQMGASQLLSVPYALYSGSSFTSSETQTAEQSNARNGGGVGVLSATEWGINGNSGIAATNFIGTTTTAPLKFRVDGINSGMIDMIKFNTFLGFQSGNSTNSTTTGGSNTGVGVNSLYTNTTGWYNTADGAGSLSANISGSSNCAVGFFALGHNISGGANTALGAHSLFENLIGWNNTATGYQALSNNKASSNTALGASALYGNITGTQNTAIGDNSLHENQTGSWNTATGHAALFFNHGNYNTANGQNALLSNTTGNQNTACGSSALHSNTGGGINSAFGHSALYSNTSGDGNTASGFRSLYSNITGDQNTATGVNALKLNTADANTAIGYGALSNNISGNGNTGLGCQANVASGSSLLNATAIGANAIVAVSSTMILGNNAVNVGIGLSSNPIGPQNKLEINGKSACESGLRFRRLTTACLPIPNPGAGVLALNSVGDVIYVQGGTQGSQWTLSGNTIVAGTDFIGTINNADWVIKTQNIERMRVMGSDGKVGIGSITPEFRLTVGSECIPLNPCNDGGILGIGTFGSGTVLTTAVGPGTRMLWYPRKAAFRAGFVDAAQWSNSNIGNYSFASGWNSVASGEASTASGYSNTAGGNYSTAMGSFSTALGINSTAMGQSQTNGNYSTAMGYQSTTNGHFSTAMGYIAYAGGIYSTAMGKGTYANGSASTAMGFQTSATGDNSTSMGYESDAGGNTSTAIGYLATASGDHSTAIGNYVTTNGQPGSFVIGDNNTFLVASFAPNEFISRFEGGYTLWTDAALTMGVSLASGGGSWNTVSDRRKKENFQTLNAEDAILKIKDIPITEWNYISQNKSIHHIGPMAQDFYSLFKLDGIGNDTTINSSDIDGVNMLGIQALEQRTAKLILKVNEQQQIIEKLQTQNAEIKNLRAELVEMKLLFIQNEEAKK